MVRRVALLSLHSSPLAELGGTDVGGMNVYVRRLALRLGAAGVAVDVFTRRSASGEPETVPLGRGVRLVHLDAGPARYVPKRELPLHVPEMTCAMARFAEGQRLAYDAIYGHYWVSGLVAERFRLTVAERPPLLQMFHTLAKVKERYTGAIDPADSVLRADAERRLLRRADAIVGSTEAERHELEALYGHRAREYHVIPPGVDLAVFRPLDRRRARALVGGIDERYVILYVGRFDRLKGLDTLIRAVAGLPARVRSHLQLLLVGGDRGERNQMQADRVARLARDLGIDALVEFRGRVPQRELRAYYAAADVCAIPSLHESFGITAIEAMACQIPVVASRVGGLATTIEDGVTGYLAPPGNVEAFRTRLMEALTAPDRATLVRRAGLTVQRYTWDRTATRTLRLLEELSARCCRDAAPALS